MYDSWHNSAHEQQGSIDNLMETLWGVSPCGKATFILCFLKSRHYEEVKVRFQRTRLCLRSRNTNCLVCAVAVIHRDRDASWHTHTLNVETLGWKCVVACTSAVIPWLLWHLSVSFSPFFCSLFHPDHSRPVLTTSIYSRLSSLLCSPLSSDTCHYPVLNRPFSRQNVSARLTVTARVCVCVIKGRVCVQLHWSVCVRVYLCVSTRVSHPVSWKIMSKSMRAAK